MLGYSRLYSQYNSCSHKKREMWTEIHTKGEDHVHREAEITDLLDLQAKKCRGWPAAPRSQRRRRRIPSEKSLQSLQREHAPADTFISDCENKFLLLSVIQFIILCLGSPRKVIHKFMEGLTSFPIFLKLIYKSNTTAIKILACFL